jgi:hypothetical protein
MRPQLLKVSTEPGHSFSVRRDLVPYINNRWHFHTEVELIHFKRGQGTQFVGDNMQRFRAGDVVLVGSNLPHYWRFDDAYFEEYTEVTADVRVAHFSNNFCGDAFMHLPEAVHLKTVLDKAKRGVQVEGEARKKVADLLEKLLDADGMHRLLLLIEALYTIAVSPQTRQLSSIGFQHTFQEAEYERINTIYEYSLQHFRRPILLEEISADMPASCSSKIISASNSFAMRAGSTTLPVSINILNSSPAKALLATSVNSVTLV